MASIEDIIVPPSERVSRELDLDTILPPLRFDQEFGNDNPVELEIGIGKGLFLQHAAQEHPDRNFVGIEIRRKYLNVAKARIEKRPLANARLVCGEAFEFMEQFLRPDSLSVIHVYFPDPWPKKRHHRRRLFSPDFMAEVNRVLLPGGQLLIATDHYDYWTWITEVLQEQTYLRPCEREPEKPAGADGLTNYEIKYKREGRPIYRCGYEKPHEP